MVALTNTIKKYWVSVLLTLIFLARLHNVCPDISFCAALGNQNNQIEEVSETPFLNKARINSEALVQRKFRPYQAALVLGLVLGINKLYYYPQFRSALINTGTIHVVVVSGFNISLLIGFISRLSNTRNKIRAGLIMFATLGYCLLVGLSPPVFRAWLMSVASQSAQYYGRNLDGMEVLYFCGVLMLIYNPLYLFDLSYQLSFAATFGLIYYDGFIKRALNIKSTGLIISDFVTTLSAQIFVAPLLVYYFGSVSLLGLFVNPLVLWTTPIATVLGFGYIIFGSITDILGYIFYFPLYLLTEFFIRAIFLFDRWSLELVFDISYKHVIIYYVLAILLPKILYFSTWAVKDTSQKQLKTSNKAY